MTIINGTLAGFSLVAGYGGGIKDPDGPEQVASGGNSSALNVTAAAVIKASPGRICKITVITAPTTSGALTVNDSATLSGVATGNEIFSLPYGSVTAGLVITLDFPCINGIAISAVGGGTPQYAVSYH